MPDLSPLPQVITITEALDWWGLRSPKTVINRLFALAHRQKNYEGIIRRSGKIYLVTVEAMTREFGQPKNERPKYE